MGGDDSQKLLPWRGSAPLRGANLRLHYEINTLTQTRHSDLPRQLPRAEGAIAPSPVLQGSATGCLGHSWKAQVGHFWRAPKPGVTFDKTSAALL